MKTISLELDEKVYPQVVNFLRLLPEKLCHIMEDDDTVLTPEEYSTIKAIQAKLDTGDESDFLDWDEVKDKL